MTTLKKASALSLTAGALTVGLLGVASPAFADAGGVVTQPVTTLTVNSLSDAPVDAGTFLTNSQFSILVSATGSAQHAGRSDGSDITGPDGVPTNGTSSIETEPDALAKDLPIGALIGRLGADGSWFLIGNGSVVVPTTKTSQSSQELYLAYNDSWYADNDGFYAVTISRTKAAEHSAPTTTLSRTAKAQ